MQPKPPPTGERPAPPQPSADERRLSAVQVMKALRIQTAALQKLLRNPLCASDAELAHVQLLALVKSTQELRGHVEVVVREARTPEIDLGREK